jgi:hypothetical protein
MTDENEPPAADDATAADMAALAGPYIRWHSIAWREQTDAFTLEQEGALARIVNWMVANDRPFPQSPESQRIALGLKTVRKACQIVSDLCNMRAIVEVDGGWSCAFAQKALAHRAALMSKQRANARQKRNKNNEGNAAMARIDGFAKEKINEKYQTASTLNLKNAGNRRAANSAAKPLGDALAESLAKMEANVAARNGGAS